jgi:hypothetical protein
MMPTTTIAANSEALNKRTNIFGRRLSQQIPDPACRQAQGIAPTFSVAAATELAPVEHPFGTLKMCIKAMHFLMKTLPNVATEMAPHVLAYNLTRVMNIVGIKPLLLRSGREKRVL